MCDIIEYPHCKITIVVEAMNCPPKIQSNTQLNKSSCEFLYNNGLIYGCGKPFRV